MQQPPTLLDETQRLRTLQGLNLPDTLPEERFDRFTRLAATETGRDISLCGHAMLRDEPLHIPDALRDPRFADNPLVTGATNIRFHAGQPIHANDGSRIGNLRLIDCKSRELAEPDLAALADLASMVERETALRSLATVDELTRLSNRRGFSDIARHVLGQRPGCHCAARRRRVRRVGERRDH